MKLLKINMFLSAFLLFSFSNKLCSQDKKNHEVQHDTTKINLLIERGIEVQGSKPDSALYYFEEAINIANYNYKKHRRFKELEAYGLRLAGFVNWQTGNNELAINQYLRVVEIYEEINVKKELADSYNRLGMIHASYGKYFESKVFFDKFLIIGKELKDSAMIARAYNNMGLVNWNIGVYDKALESFMKALAINEKLGDIFILAGNYNNIGNIHNSMGNPEKAVEYYYKSLEIAIELDAKQQIAGSYNNIGASLKKISKNSDDDDEVIDAIDKSIYYYQKALEICKEINDNRTMSLSYNNIGTSYHDKALLTKRKNDKVINFNRSIKNLEESIRLKEIMGDKNGLSVSFDNISNVYLDMSEMYENDSEIYRDYLNTALQYAEKSMKISEETRSVQRTNVVARTLMKIHRALGLPYKALDFAELYIETKDSLFNEEKTKAITELETIYETEKKQKEIETQQLVIEKQTLEHQKQIAIRNLLIIGAGLIAVFAILIFIGYKQKHRSNRLIKEKNILLEQANEEIRSQKDEIESQHSMVVKHKNHIENQKKKIDDSILYARHIQSAMLLAEDQLNNLLGDFFFVFRPKEIVSGDYYWAANVKGRLIIAVADCTGHGVPGAFMSILGISLLNEIVRRKEVIEPSEILEKLRESLIEALVHDSDTDMKREGMAISIASINIKNHECLWAGARNPTWIVKANDNGDIEELKPDNTSVAKHLKMKKFSTKQIKLKKDDVIYMFTDGIIDQFGGPEGKKFSSRQLRQIISQNAGKPLNEQKQAVEKALDEWQNPAKNEYFEQVDDITVMAIKF